MSTPLCNWLDKVQFFSSLLLLKVCFFLQLVKKMQSEDFYLSEVEKSRAMAEMNERMNKVLYSLVFSNIFNSKMLFLFPSWWMSACLNDRYVALWSLLKFTGLIWLIFGFILFCFFFLRCVEAKDWGSSVPCWDCWTAEEQRCSDQSVGKRKCKDVGWIGRRPKVNGWKAKVTGRDGTKVRQWISLNFSILMKTLMYCGYFIYEF